MLSSTLRVNVCELFTVCIKSFFLFLSSNAVLRFLLFCTEIIIYKIFMGFCNGMSLRLCSEVLLKICIGISQTVSTGIFMKFCIETILRYFKSFCTDMSLRFLTDIYEIL